MTWKNYFFLAFFQGYEQEDTYSILQDFILQYIINCFVLEKKERKKESKKERKRSRTKEQDEGEINQEENAKL